MKNFLLVLVMIFVTCPCNADTLQPSDQKDWRFALDAGSVVVRLTSSPSTDDGRPIYNLQIMSENATPSVLEEASCLRKVTEAMQRQGMSPRRIVAIALELQEPDVRTQLSIAASRSEKWRSAKPSEYGRVVADLLNSEHAYQAFNQLFGEYGLTVEVAHAKYISTVRPEEIGLSPNGIRKLPSGATLNMVLRRAN